MSYTQGLQDIVHEYLEAGHRFPANASDIAAWAIEKGIWQPQRGDMIKQCARQLAQAMREEYITDPQGRRVRAKHVLRMEKDGKQESFWTDIRIAKRPEMEMSFQQRRQHIVGECKQLKTDVDSYNENFNPSKPIQAVFDFTHDLEELEAIEI